MANDSADIDLYADDLEFNQETNEFNDQNVDLYDDVITASGKSNANNSMNEEFSQTQDSNHTQNNEFNSTNDQTHHHSNSSSTKKIGIYVGNLTWWTTDQDIVQSINGIGINDIIEVKFFENRANGQSKGFCVVSLGSESSVKAVIDKLPKTEIHGQNPVVTVCNKQNLNHFEMQSRKNNPGHANNNNNNNNNNMNNMGNMNNGPGNHNMRPPFSGNNPMGMPNAGHNMRPPLINRPQRPNGPLLSSQPPRGMPIGPQGPYNQGGNMQNQNLWNQHLPNNQSGPGNRGGRGPMHNSPQGGGPPRPNPMGGPPRMPGNVSGMQRNSSQPLLRAPGVPSDGHRGVGHNGQMGGSQDWDNSHNVGMSSGPMVQQSSMDMHGPSHVNPHVNPAFFGGQSQDPYNRSSSSAPYGSNDYGRPPHSSQGSSESGMMMSQLSENEFEELMSKNRHVSSNAITRAVSDASVGDFSSAIETLVTAISLIKQSKVANDERCKILISSLQDTLHGIETKSYSMSRKDRPKSRDRSRERRDKRRDREYRSRSREKDRRNRSRSNDSSPARHRGRDSYRSRESKYRDRSRDKYKS